jgi:molecular chaperone DnaJ
VRASVSITLEDAAFGVKKDLQVNHMETCEHCKGNGCAEGTTPEVCQQCGGQGTVRMQQRTMFGSMSTTTVCPNCRGEGKIIHQPCKHCGGAGSLRRAKKISVTIPAGIDEGQAISLRGQGDIGKNGGSPGDLIVGIRVQPHPILKRSGNTIQVEQAIGFVQAALGAEMEIPTLDGKVKFTIPEATQTGTTFRLRDKGVPNLNGRGRGDQLITVRVETPRKLTATQKEALRQFAAALEPESNPPAAAGGAPDGGGGESEESAKGFFGKSKRKK